MSNPLKKFIRFLFPIPRMNWNVINYFFVDSWFGATQMEVGDARRVLPCLVKKFKKI